MGLIYFTSWINSKWQEIIGWSNFLLNDICITYALIGLNWYLSKTSLLRNLILPFLYSEKKFFKIWKNPQSVKKIFVSKTGFINHIELVFAFFYILYRHGQARTLEREPGTMEIGTSDKKSIILEKNWFKSNLLREHMCLPINRYN